MGKSRIGSRVARSRRLSTALISILREFLSTGQLPGRLKQTQGSPIIIQKSGLLKKTYGPPIIVEKNGLFIPDLGLALDESKHGYFLDNLSIARNLREFGVVFSNDGELIIGRWRDIRFVVDDLCSLLTAREIFAENVYGFDYGKSAVVLDIGMNVGLASLYFASIPSVRKVYGFEPFSFTFQKAQSNFALNPSLIGKIAANNTGVAGSRRTAEVSFNRQDHTSMGIHGVVEEHVVDPELNQIERIQLEGVSQVISRIRSEHPGTDMIVKMDCEGSEYEIVERMKKDGLLREVTHFQIEWHVFSATDNPSTIISTLRENGFFCNRTQKNQNLGMIFASRLN